MKKVIISIVAIAAVIGAYYAYKTHSQKVAVEVSKEQTLANNKKAADYLTKAGVLFIATIENGEPRVRPVGTVDVINGKLTLATGSWKALWAQLEKNPQVEISAFSGNKDGWIRIRGRLVNVANEQTIKQIFSDIKGLDMLFHGHETSEVRILQFEGPASVHIQSFTGQLDKFNI